MAEAQRFPNGFIPENVLVTFGSGYRADYGNWKHQLSVSSYLKHKRLQELSLRNRGKKLQISEGNNAYRDYAGQVFARQHHGNNAAVPGTSSHGGYWEGKNTLAMDYGNWSYVYGGDRAAFYRDVRSAGLSPGLISPERGYPDEPWHVVDLEPWIVPSGGGSYPTPEKPEEEEEEDEMSLNVLWQTTDPTFAIRAAVGNDVSGLWIEVTSNDAGITNTLANRYKTGDAVVTTTSAFGVARNAHAAVRTGS